MVSDDDRRYFDYLESEILGWIDTYILNSGQLPASDYDADTTDDGTRAGPSGPINYHVRSHPFTSDPTEHTR